MCVNDESQEEVIRRADDYGEWELIKAKKNLIVRDMTIDGSEA